MKQLGYGKEYSYNPDYSHPVYNVGQFGMNRASRWLLLMKKECLPSELASHSSSSDTPHEQFLKSVEAEAAEKRFDGDRLAEWESKANRNRKWPGRSTGRSNGL